MSSVKTIDILNRLVAIHHRSLPMYLNYATPYVERGNGTATETLDSIVESNKEFVDRFGEFVANEGGATAFGEFPIVFTGYHDLGLHFLVPQMIQYQERDIDLISDCVEQLNGAPMAKAIAEESLGAARAHLDSLNELLASL